MFRCKKYATLDGTIDKIGAERLGALFHVIRKIFPALKKQKIEDNTDKFWRHFPLPKEPFVRDIKQIIQN